MKFKVVLSSILVLALLFAFVVHVHAWGASAFCIRSYTLGFTTADALIGSPGLKNGTYHVYAKVDDTDVEYDSFGNEIVFDWASDYYDGTSLPAVASASVCGHDGAGKYLCDHDSDDI